MIYLTIHICVTFTYVIFKSMIPTLIMTIFIYVIRVGIIIKTYSDNLVVGLPLTIAGIIPALVVGASGVDTVVGGDNALSELITCHESYIIRHDLKRSVSCRSNTFISDGSGNCTFAVTDRFF